MQVLAFQELPSIPSLGSLIGTTGQAELLSSISKQWGDGGTHFGKPGDMFLDNQMTFLRGIIAPAKAATDIMKKTVGLFTGATAAPQIIPIVEPGQLQNVPSSMVLPILTMPIIRDQLRAGTIYGFGFAVGDLPAEDVTGRLLNNGVCVMQPGVENVQVWTWKTTDPRYTVEELDMLKATREFVQWFTENQLQQPAPERIDPTDYPNHMGKLKSK